MINKIWTDIDIEKLKRMYADNYSMSQIASVLGTTRNAISGKVMRLGLTGSRTVAIKCKKNSPRKVSRAPRTRSQPAKPQRVIGSQLFVEFPEVEYADDSAMLPGSPPLGLSVVIERQLPSGADRPVTFEELGPNDCRAPLGDGQHFCGKTKGLNWRGGVSSYCPEHHGLYHEKPRSAYRPHRVALHAMVPR